MTGNVPSGLPADAAMTAAVLQQLTSGVPPGPWPDPRPATVETALDWQQTGASRIPAEMHSVLNGKERGRMVEIIGRIASAGEQLGLAWTCQQEAMRWIAAGGSGWEIGSRACSEMVGYWCVSAAHGLANVTLRTLLLHDAAASIINRKYPGAKGFPAFSGNRESWRPLNPGLAGTLQEAADATLTASAQEVTRSLANLTSEPSWTSLSEQRDVDFHRWRPQSVSGGVPPENLWEAVDQGWQLSWFGVGQYDPPSPVALAKGTADALDVLTCSMETWLTIWPRALRDLGVPVFKA